MSSFYEKLKNFFDDNFLFNLLLCLLTLCFGIIFFVGPKEEIEQEEIKQVVIVQRDTIYITSPLIKKVTLTVYRPTKEECDDSPLVTANGTNIDIEKLKRGELRYCAVSQDLLSSIPYGSTIYIEGYGVYKVVDTMNEKLKNYVDILQDVSKPIFKKENVVIIKIN